MSAGEAGKYLDTVATNECSSENVSMVVTVHASCQCLLWVCVCVFVCACVCVCVRARKRVYLKRVVVITVNQVEELLEALFFLCWSYEQLLGWGINMEWTKKVKVRFILKGHLSGQLLSWPTP